MFNCLKKIQHFFRTPRGTVVVKLGMQCSEEVEKVEFVVSKLGTGENLEVG
jgi:hypothetical protein